jgi:hypothetical protein
MVGGDKHPFPVPDFSPEAVEIIYEQRGCGIVAENKIEIKLRVVIFGNRPVAGPMLKENVVRVGIRAFHGEVKPQAH